MLICFSFSPEGYDSGYVVSWKELGQENEAQEEGLEEAGGSASWESQETEATGDPPTVQIQVEGSRAQGKL